MLPKTKSLISAATLQEEKTLEDFKEHHPTYPTKRIRIEVVIYFPHPTLQ